MKTFRVKWVPWIAGISVGGMMLWLITSAVTLNTLKTDSPGSLFGKPVSLHDYTRALEAVTHDALLRYGDQYRSQVKDSQLRDQAWERLVLLTEARRQKIKVTNAEVVTEIQRIPLFHREDGQFDPAGYQVVLRYSLGTTPHVFEEETREDLMIRKLLQQAIGNPALTADELKEIETKNKTPEEQKKAEKELLDQKRLKAYLTWYQELIKRAAPPPKSS